jgi:hypothetical protein
MTTVAVCDVCKEVFRGNVVDVLKWKLLRINIITSEPLFYFR